MNAHEARQATSNAAVPAADPNAVTEAVARAHELIAKASIRGASEVDVPIGLIPEPILTAALNALRKEGYTVYRQPAAQVVTIHW